MPGAADILFLEIEVVDPSTFSDVLDIRGVTVGDHRILRAHFEWSEGNPIDHLFRYLILGQGDTPPVVREIIRQYEPDPANAQASTSEADSVLSALDFTCGR